jgi:hypothetical protein
VKVEVGDMVFTDTGALEHSIASDGGSALWDWSRADVYQVIEAGLTIPHITGGMKIEWLNVEVRRLRDGRRFYTNTRWLKPMTGGGKEARQ